MTKILVNNLSKKYDNRIIFESIDININKNGLYILTGNNGSGKSTFFKILKGIENADCGTIDYVNNNGVHESIAVNVSYCPAYPTLFENLTVRENIEIITCHPDDLIYYLNLFEIKHLIDKKTSELSAGEKIRVCLIRTIMENKPIILLDEITKHLDKRLRKIILNELDRLSNERIIIFTTHYQSDIPKDYEKILRFDSLRLRYECQEDKETIHSLEAAEANYKIVNKVFNWRLNYLFMFIMFIMLLFIIIMTTYRFESGYKSMYRHSINQESYVLKYDERQIIDSNIKVEGLLENQEFHNVYLVEGLLDTKTFVNTNDIFDYEINRFNIVNSYKGNVLSEGEVVVSDFFYFCLIYKNLIYENNVDKVFYFYDTPIKVVGTYKTSFSSKLPLFNVDVDIMEYDKEKKNNESQDAILSKLLEDYNFFFDYTYLYNQVYCNERTFDLFVKISRYNQISSTLYLSDLSKNENVSYDLLIGRFPSSENEVVVTEQTFIQLIKDKYGVYNKDISYYLNDEYVYSFYSIDGIKKQEITFNVVGVTSSITQRLEIIDMEVTHHYGIIYYDNDGIIDILSWQDFFILDKTIGFLGNIDKKTVQVLYENGYIFMNNNTLSLLNSYKIKEQFNDLVTVIIATCFIFYTLIYILSCALEYRFIAQNLDIVKYTCVNKYKIYKYIFLKEIVESIAFSILLIFFYLSLSYTLSNNLSDILDVNVCLFDSNIFAILLCVVIFVVTKVLKNYIFSLRFKE